MEITNQFSTRTDQRWYAAYTAVMSLVLGIAGGIFMWVWLKMAEPALFIFGITLLCGLFIFLALRKQKNIPLHFYGNLLHIFHLDGMEYKIEAVPGWVFQFRQNPLERKYNVGRIKIKGTGFYLYGVQNYAETCRYIQENFPDF